MDGVNLNIEGGSYCCLLGPSGCGKTTMLRMIAGHENPSDGEICIDGNNVVGQSPRERGTAMMFQSYALFPHLTVLENVAFSLRVRGTSKAERQREAGRVYRAGAAHGACEPVAGAAFRRPAAAGGPGACAITRPRVLLLDEPLSALDEFLRLQMRAELREMQQQLGITFVHVTHTQLEAVAVADQVVVMDHGKVRQSSSARGIYAEPDSACMSRGSWVARTCCPGQWKRWLAGSLPSGRRENRSPFGWALAAPYRARRWRSPCAATGSR